MTDVKRGSDALPTLRQVYENLVRENDRLRDARRSVTAQLGPLPAASAIVVGLFGALGDQVRNGLSTDLYKAAVVLFIVIGVISTLALFSKPYRKLKEKLLVDGGMSSDTKDELDWLDEGIRVERELAVELARRFDRERGAMLTVQVLFVIQIALLLWIPLVD